MSERGRRKQFALSALCVFCSLCVLCAAAGSAAPPAADQAFQRFFDARSPDDAAKAVQAVVNSGVTLDEALARLKVGRVYPVSAKRGQMRLLRRAAAGDFFYDVDVPATYDPARAYQLRVQLHGGVMMRDNGESRGRGGRGGNSPL